MKSAPPIAPPGCPDFAFSTIEAARIRILSAAFINTELVAIVIVVFYHLFLYHKFSKNISIQPPFLRFFFEKFLHIKQKKPSNRSAFYNMSSSA
jgi:hypothetical protein